MPEPITNKISHPLQIGEWMYIPEQDKLMKLDADGRLTITADLDNLCQKVMNYFILKAGKLVTKDELLLDVWGIRDVSDGRITRVIRVLRVALGDDTREPRYIETIPKRGYRLIAPVTEITLPEVESTDDLLTAKETEQVLFKKKHLFYAAFVCFSLLLGLMAWLFFFAKQDIDEPIVQDIPKVRYTSITSLDGLEFYHHVSSDENYLVYSYLAPAAKNKAVLILQDFKEHNRIQLTDASYDAFGASFNPDATQIAYQRSYASGACEIRIITLNTERTAVSQDELLKRCADKSVSIRMAWSPDGKYLVYPNMDEAKKQLVLHMTAIDNRITEVLTAPPSSSFGDYVARFSRSGDKLVFLREVTSSAQIWLLNLKDRSSRLLTTVTDVVPGNIDWDLTDSAIVYPLTSFSIGKISLHDLKTQELFFTDNSASELQVTSSGKIVTSIGSFSRINPKKISNPVKNNSLYNQAVFNSNRNETYIEVNPVEGGPTAVVSRRSGLPQVWFFYADGSQRQVTHFTDQQRIRDVRFSPDGKNLLVQLSEEILLLDEDGKTSQIAGKKDAILAYPSWSKDGLAIFYSESHQGRWQIIKRSLNQLDDALVFANDMMFYYESYHADYAFWRSSKDKFFYMQNANKESEALPINLPETQFTYKFELRKDGIYYVDFADTYNYRLNYFNFKNNSVLSVLDTVQYGRFSLSADEQFIFILEFDFGDMDIAFFDAKIASL